MKKPQHKAYNGHKNWNHWNVSLWLSKDQGLYYLTLQHEDDAAGMLQTLQEMGITHTPDGAPYSVTTIKAAMRGMK